LGRPPSQRPWVARAKTAALGYWGDAATLGLEQPAEQAHDKVMGLAVGVNCPADLGHPQSDAVVGKDGEHELELRT
jgi:hypothetical protein